MAPVKIAFLVGVSDYGGNGKDLDFCVKDVDRLATVLERKGFQCHKWIDKPLPDILDAEALPLLLATATKESDTVVFYFSGHGEDLGGEQILLGKGVQHHDMQSALFQGNVLPLSTVLDVLVKTTAQKVVIVDACRVPSFDQKPAADLYKGRAQTMGSLDNCAVVFASADGKKSFGTPDNKHSRFTHEFTEALKQYGRGILSVFEAAVRGVSQYNDGKRQTPWIYASLQERMLDGFNVIQSDVGGIRFPRYLCGGPVHGVWAILSGSNALATYRVSKWVCNARLPEFLLENLIGFDCRAGTTEYVFVRSKLATLALVTVAPVVPWQESGVSTQTISTRQMSRYFGANWSPSGERLLAYGVPATGKAGVVFWNFATAGHKKIEVVEGMPVDVECNAAVWLDDFTVIASLYREDLECTHVYCIQTDGRKWTASPPISTPHAVRISALTVNSGQDIFCGCDDGSVGVVEPHRIVLFGRKHAFSGRNCYERLPWTGRNSKGGDMSQLGVCHLVYDHLRTGLIGVSYFDGTVAIFDPVLETYVKDATLKGLPLRPGIVLVGPSKFMSEGQTGLILDIPRF